DLGADGLPVYNGTSRGTRTTTGPANFNQWYRDVPGVNMRVEHTLEMRRNPGSTIWSYSNSAFFPLDVKVLVIQPDRNTTTISRWKHTWSLIMKVVSTLPSAVTTTCLSSSTASWLSISAVCMA